jgi:hypothetical protein
MSNIDTRSRPETRRTAPVWRSRLLAVVAAGAGAALVHVVATASGAEMEAPIPGQGIAPVTVVNTVISALVAGFLGWAARAVLDRFAPRKAVAVWLIGASLVFTLELFPPLLADATPGTKTALLVMHGVVAAILFPVLAKRRVPADADAVN